jgi:hypothetical protein
MCLGLQDLSSIPKAAQQDLVEQLLLGLVAQMRQG